MSAWSFYSKQTGLFRGTVFVGPESLLPANTPEDHAAIEGVFNPSAHRVDLATGEVIDWTAPQPPADELTEFGWDPDRKRWLPKPTLKALKLRSADRVKVDIERIEAGQARALRDLALASDDASRASALARLQQVETRVARRRERLAAIDAAPDADTLTEIVQTPAPD